MADDAFRAARQKALAEKKRRLEEIKARRRQPVAAASVAGAKSSSSSSTAAGLDSYIDDLLKTSAPGLTLSADAPPRAAADVTPAGREEVQDGEDEGVEDSGEEGIKAAADTAAVATETGTTAPPPPLKVETFEIAVQCEDDDFPPPSLVDEEERDASSQEGHDDDDDDDDEGDENTAANDDDDVVLQLASSYDFHVDNHRPRRPSRRTSLITVPLTQEERSKMLSSPPFVQFLSTASKRVERLLGAGEETMYGILNESGWGMGGGGGKAVCDAVGGSGADFSVDYANDDEGEGDDEGVDGAGGGARRRKHRAKQAQEEPYQSGGLFVARATYEFPSFTRGRSVTDVEWCPGAREWVLASYGNVRSGGKGETATAGNSAQTMGKLHNPTTRHLLPCDSSSSFLQTASSAIPNEGIVAIYNLSMPSRPEHVFCAGCPILHTQFHPTEHPKLVLGGASSGQVLVWDARVGRYPVQRSGAQGAGHDCELVGMKVFGAPGSAIEGGGAGGGSLSTSKLVTASSDGKVNYWSVSNLREPAESVQVHANLSCLETLDGHGEGVVCGDECGGLHAILAGTGRDGTSSSARRVVRTLHPGAVVGGGATDLAATEEGTEAAVEAPPSTGHYGGHYGMVTAVSMTSALGCGTSKGFLRGASGLMVTTGVDWSTKLWAPAYSTKDPLMSFLSNSYDYMCDVQWNPVHPSIFATASSNGTLNIWNLAVTIDQPVSGTEGIHIDTNSDSSGISSESSPRRQGLNRLQWSLDGRRMAVAAGDKLHVLGVGEELWKSKGDEEGRVMHHLVSRGLIQE